LAEVLARATPFQDYAATGEASLLHKAAPVLAKIQAWVTAYQPEATRLRSEYNREMATAARLSGRPATAVRRIRLDRPRADRRPGRRETGRETEERREVNNGSGRSRVDNAFLVRSTRMKQEPESKISAFCRDYFGAEPSEQGEPAEREADEVADRVVEPLHGSDKEKESGRKKEGKEDSDREEWKKESDAPRVRA